VPSARRHGLRPRERVSPRLRPDSAAKLPLESCYTIASALPRKQGRYGTNREQTFAPRRSWAARHWTPGISAAREKALRRNDTEPRRFVRQCEAFYTLVCPGAAEHPRTECRHVPSARRHGLRPRERVSPRLRPDSRERVNRFYFGQPTWGRLPRVALLLAGWNAKPLGQLFPMVFSPPD
jgi:hypothetical protein